MLTPSLEDYLEEIYRFSLDLKGVRVTDISNKLNVSLPSVSKALNKLKKKQYILYQPYGEITLTAKGKELGHFLVERNQILQEFLLLIHANCDIGAEAEAIEHYLSKPTINAIQVLLKFMSDHPACYDSYQSYWELLESKAQETDSLGKNETYCKSDNGGDEES